MNLEESIHLIRAKQLRHHSEETFYPNGTIQIVKLHATVLASKATKQLLTLNLSQT